MPEWLLPAVAAGMGASFLAHLALSLWAWRLSSSPAHSRVSRRLWAAVQGGRYHGAVGVVPQAPAGCGIACFRMVIGRFGLQEPRRDDEFEITSWGSSVQSLVEALRARGVEAKGLRFRGLKQLREFLAGGDWSVMLLIREPALTGPLRPLLAPATFVVKLVVRREIQPFHWVCLDALDETAVCVSDPLVGRVSYNRERFSELWDGIAVVAERMLTAASFHAFGNAGTGDRHEHEP